MNVYKQRTALEQIPDILTDIETYSIPLRAYQVSGIEKIRALLVKDDMEHEIVTVSNRNLPQLKDIISNLIQTDKKVIFTMGKGGVGKSTVASAIALGLSEKGKKVHLATTDPAAHLKYVAHQTKEITISHIDAEEELKKYQREVLEKARKTMSEDDLSYIKEDLRSPCTQEIAVFRAFAEIVEKAEQETVVIDTAPTGHTLLLLDSTQNYHREVERTQGGTIPEAITKLLPRLRSEETEVLIITLAETTPVFESERLEEDLRRAGISSKWWIINSSLYLTQTENELLKARSDHEIPWINYIAKHTKGNYVAIPWIADEVKGLNLKKLL